MNDMNNLHQSAKLADPYQEMVEQQKRQELLAVTMDLIKSRIGNNVVDIVVSNLDVLAFVEKAQEIIRTVDHKMEARKK